MSHAIIDPIDISLVLREYQSIEDKINWLANGGGRQCGIQYKDGEDYFISATGTRPVGVSEKEYCLINPLFQNTIFEDIINKYNLVRARLMWVNGKSCYSLHSDDSPRLHIPLITNPHCMFIFPNKPELIHLPLGNVYAVNTINQHSFCNFSNTPRLHFMGCMSITNYMKVK